MGENGFIGRHISESCNHSGIFVIPLERWDGNPKNLERQLHYIKTANPECPIILVQAAWYSTSNRDYRIAPQNNIWVKTTLTIIEICKKNKIIFVGLGSCLEKLNTADDIYSRSKIKILNYLTQESSFVDWIWFQIHYVYSRDLLKPEVVRKAAAAKKSGEKLELMTPNSTHDFIEVRDAANAIVHSISHEHRGKIEIGTGKLLSVSYLLHSLFPEVEILEQNSTVARISYEQPASIEILVDSGWIPKYSLT